MANNENSYLKEEPDQFQRKYRISNWWLTHKELLKKIGIGIFIAFDALLVIFVLWTVVDTYLLDYQTEQAAVANLVTQGQEDIRAYTEAHAADPLNISEPRSFVVDEGTHDFYTTVENLNDEWYATFDYSFTYSGGETDRLSGFVLPNEERPLAILGVEADSTPRSIEIQIENFEWHRVDRRTVGDYTSWAESRLDLPIEDIRFSTDVEVDGESIGRTEFTVTNNTAYNYYEPTFYILLRRGGDVVGVNKTTLSALRPGDERQVRVNWFGVLPAATRVEVLPAINIFDQDAYQDLGR